MQPLNLVRDDICSVLRSAGYDPSDWNDDRLISKVRDLIERRNEEVCFDLTESQKIYLESLAVQIENRRLFSVVY